jgi:hypothetical protein
LGKLKTVVVVAGAYIVLGALSAYFAYSNQDAWGVWLASGFALGLMLVRERSDWMPVLAGAFVGAFVFEPLIGSTLVDALIYALTEVAAAYAGAAVAAALSPIPLRFVSPRDAGAALAGAAALALAGAVIVGLWDEVGSRLDAWRTFRVWLAGNFVGTLLVAPFVASWALSRPERSRVPRWSFAAGAVACALFLGCLLVLFSGHARGGFLRSFPVVLTLLPFVLFVAVALLWGVRGTTLTALLGALIAIAQTVRGLGPFVGGGLFGETALDAQGYAAALAVTGLIVATIVERRRLASSETRV